MENFSQNYINDIKDLFLQTQVTDLNQVTLGLESAIDQVRDKILSANSKGRKVIFAGNGGSAAVANHKALDFWFTGQIRGVSFSDDALLTCVSNDFGYEQVFAKPINMFADSDDIFIGISSSGNSENIIQAAEEARHRGCFIVTFSGFAPDNRLRKMGELNFYLPAKHYNKVESTHLLLCDVILEAIVAYRKQFISTGEKSSNGGQQDW